MRTSTAYFAGVGTVIIAVGAGLGGGYLAANIAHPPVQTVSKLERRMSAEPIPVATAPAQEQQHAQQQQAQPQQTESPLPTQAAAPAAVAPRTDEKTANNVAAAQPAPSPPQPSKPAEQAEEKTAAPRDSYARASDTDIKRTVAEKRRAERRQQWADKRRWKQPREQEIDTVEDRVREVTEPRRIRIREEGEPRGFFGEPGRRDMFAEPVRSEAPRIRLFDQDD
jgi:hypothetical protein